VYIEQPEGYVQYGPNGEEMVCKLKKSIYGLRQSPRNWNSTIHKFMVENDFIQSQADPCMYIKPNMNPKLPNTVVIIYVDDLIIGGLAAERAAFDKAFSEKFKIKKLGRVHWMLGIEVLFHISSSEVIIELLQTQYINDILKRYSMSSCTFASTPRAQERSTESVEFGDALPEENLYRNIVGNIMYASLATRPDIAEAVGKLSRSMTKPTEDDMIMAKRVLRYLGGTKEYGLRFSSSESAEIVMYVDANFADAKEEYRSTTGWVIMKSGAAVNWQSKLQSVVALSTTEAEYTATSTAGQEVVYQRQWHDSIGYKITKPTTVFNDNNGCIALAHNPIMHSRTKHLGIRQHFIRELVKNKEVNLLYCATGSMIADILTKPLSKNKTVKFRNIMMGYK